MILLATSKAAPLIAGMDNGQVAATVLIALIILGAFWLFFFVRGTW